jgi:hypothetical protein
MQPAAGFARQAVGAALPKTALGAQSLPFATGALRIKDEFVPSAAVASATFKRPVSANAPTGSPAKAETSVSRQRADEIMDVARRSTDAMRAVLESFGLDERYCVALALDPETNRFSKDEGFIRPPTRYVHDIGDFGVVIDGVYQPGMFEDIIDALNEATVDGKPLAEAYFLTDAHKSESELKEDVTKFRSEIYKTIVDVYNEMNRLDPAAQITSFSMKIDDQGKLTITDVQTEGNNPKANAKAEMFMNRKITDGIKDKAELLGFELLLAHSNEHGDVLMPGTILEPFYDKWNMDIEKQFRHEILITSGFNADYLVLSPEADAAALKEVAELSKDISGGLRGFFGGIDEPFSIFFSQKREVSLDTHSLSYPNKGIVNKLLEKFNNHFSGKESSDERSPKLSGGLEKTAKDFLKLGSVLDKLHAPSLKEGVRFAF